MAGSSTATGLARRGVDCISRGDRVHYSQCKDRIDSLSWVNKPSLRAHEDGVMSLHRPLPGPGSSRGRRMAVQSSSSAGTMMPSPVFQRLRSGNGNLPADHHHQTAGGAWPVGQLRLLVDVRPASPHRPGSACFMAPGTMRAWGRYSGVNANLILRICAGRQPDFWRISSL